MTQYIEKSALVVEIENIKSIEFNGGTPFDNYACMALDMVKEVLDTLEVKEVDLWAELGNYIEHYRNIETGYTMLGIAEYFFELGLKAQKGE